MDDTRAASHPSPKGRHTVDDDSADGVSRRWFLAGAGAVVVAGAGVGYVARVEREPAPPVPDLPPALLLAAAERERALIADLDATTGGPAALRAVLARARADHAAHLSALQELISRYDAPTPTAGASAARSPAPSGSARTASQLRAAEAAAAIASARDAAACTGSLATLLASVSASESSHAALIQ